MGETSPVRQIFLRDANGLPSLESLFGWYSQYERMIRWHERLKNDSSLDYLITFFLNCYALRDWLDKTGVWHGTDIDKRIKQEFAMRLCRDICNRSKHLTLTREPGVDANWSIVREYRGKTRPVGLVVLAGGIKSDVREIADQCVTFWNCSLNERGLI